MATPTHQELRAAIDFLQMVRREPSLLEHFEQDILRIEQLREWAQSLGYTLSEESLTKALRFDLQFRWAARHRRDDQPS